MPTSRHPQKRCSSSPGLARPHPLVAPGDPPRRHTPCPAAHPARPHHRLVMLATRPPSQCTTFASEATNATVMLASTTLCGVPSAMADVADPEPNIELLSARSPESALDVAGALPAPTHDPELALLTTPPMSPSPGLAHAKPASPSWPSGLPWSSGASCGLPEFAAWRGRKLDVQVQFVWHDSWDQMAARLNSPYYRGQVGLTPQPVISLALLPTSDAHQFARCAKGEFDGHFRQFGQIMAAIGAGDAIVRVGWEPNVGAIHHPWAFDTKDQVPAYLGCFRPAVTALRAGASTLRIEWTVAKATVWPFSVLDAYPGDGYVDVMGTHYYDVADQFSTQRKWDNFYDDRVHGGPQGLGPWIETVNAR